MSLSKCPFPAFLFGALTATTFYYFYQKFLQNKKKNNHQFKLLQNTSMILESNLYEKELNVAIECALLAGEKLKDALESDKLIHSKGRANDFVTETDRSNEELIFSKLRQHFPTHKFIGEETSATSGLPELTDEPTWIVDPIDGTTNFIHTNPLTCVSIGLAVNKIPVVGVVYAPCCGDELYVAVKGHGAYLNGKRIHVSNAQTIGDSVVLTEFGYERSQAGISKMCDTLRKVMFHGPHAIRSFGSGVLDLCYLAAGRLDALYAGVAGESWCPWDYCAGWLLIEEAGGILMTLDRATVTTTTTTPTTATERQFYMYSKSILAASSLGLGNELYEIVTNQSG